MDRTTMDKTTKDENRWHNKKPPSRHWLCPNKDLTCCFHRKSFHKKPAEINLFLTVGAIFQSGGVGLDIAVNHLADAVMGLQVLSGVLGQRPGQFVF